MNQELGLRVLAAIMEWSDERAREEYQWLRMMARLKYDGYRDFQAGMRFIESLATWLQQFALDEREVAYAFMRDRLVYISPAEMQKLVELFYPKTIWERLLAMVAAKRGISAFKVLADADGQADIERLRHQTLIMGLSDGARIDGIRHGNVGRLSNEQLVLATQLDTEKWQDLLENLRERTGDPECRFRLIYLVDDFTATGTSFFTYKEEEERWSGKLARFKNSIKLAREGLKEDPFAEDWELCVHHYIGSAAVVGAIRDRIDQATDYLQGDGWASDVHVSFGTIFPENLPVAPARERDNDFIRLTRSYYDPAIETKHTRKGGVDHLGLGYGACGLPLVLNHNTPNNAVALLWAETPGAAGVPAMRPLFRRRQRHV